MILFVKRAYSRRRQGRRFNGSRCLRRTASENKLACLKRRAWTMAGHKGAENGCSSMERASLKMHRQLRCTHCLQEQCVHEICGLASRGSNECVRRSVCFYGISRIKLNFMQISACPIKIFHFRNLHDFIFFF